MTIHKKLYYGFGSVVMMVILLSITGTTAVQRERAARAAAASAMEEVQYVESLRFQIMQNRLFLRNYLLSGGAEDEKKLHQGVDDLSKLFRQGQDAQRAAILRGTLSKIEANEQDWVANFGDPLIAKRHQVDSGRATVADLQVSYLQKIPGTWVSKSTAFLDEMSQEIQKNLEDSSFSAARASSFSGMVNSIGTILAALLGLGIVLLFSAIHHQATQEDRFSSARHCTGRGRPHAACR
jgi:CHASE3 domain sensor protein